jgi:hypothetical protein
VSTAWIAIAVSAIAFLWTVGWGIWRHRKTSRPSITASAQGVLIKVPTAPALVWCISLGATNTGQIAVTLNSVVIEIRRMSYRLVVTRWLTQTPAALPLVLDPGSGTWTGLVAVDDIRRQLAPIYGELPNLEVRACFGIAGGRHVRSSWESI